MAHALTRGKCITTRLGRCCSFRLVLKARGIADGEYLRVEGVDRDRGVVALSREGSNERMEWNPRDDAPRRSFAVITYQERETTLAVGEKVRWLRNSPKQNLMNGDQLVVQAIDGDRTTFRREDGSTVTVDANEPSSQHWTHAYANTVYRAQGQTAQRAIANLDSESGGLLNQKAFLVAISRHQQSLSIYTDSRGELERRLERHTGDKTSAIAEVERFGRARDALQQVENVRQQREAEGQQLRREHARDWSGSNSLLLKSELELHSVVNRASFRVKH